MAMLSRLLVNAPQTLFAQPANPPHPMLTSSTIQQGLISTIKKKIEPSSVDNPWNTSDRLDRKNGVSGRDSWGMVVFSYKVPVFQTWPKLRVKDGGFWGVSLDYERKEWKSVDWKEMGGKFVDVQMHYWMSSVKCLFA